MADDRRATLVTGFLADREAGAAAEALIPPRYLGPGQEARPTCVQVDFGLVRGATAATSRDWSNCRPFPSLYAFQHVLAATHREVYGLPESLSAHLDGLDAAVLSGAGRARRWSACTTRPRSC